MTTFAVSTVALAAVAGTACGGSDDAPGNLSKSAFAKQANALCSKAKADRNAQLQQLPRYDRSRRFIIPPRFR